MSFVPGGWSLPFSVSRRKDGEEFWENKSELHVFGDCFWIQISSTHCPIVEDSRNTTATEIP